MKKLIVVMALAASTSFAGETKSGCGFLGYWRINKPAVSDRRTGSDAPTAFSLTNRAGKTTTFEVSKEDLLTVMQISAASANGLCVAQSADGSLISFNN